LRADTSFLAYLSSLLLNRISMPPVLDHKLSKIYSESMLVLGHGYAPYRPEPGNWLPDEYKADGVDVCDILTLTPDGGYDYLFNCSLPKDHPKNSFGVPKIFVPFRLEKHNRRHIPNQHLSHSILHSGGMQQKESRLAASFAIACVVLLPIRTMKRRFIDVILLEMKMVQGSISVIVQAAAPFLCYQMVALESISRIEVCWQNTPRIM
jgi:hypothetical protein